MTVAVLHSLRTETCLNSLKKFHVTCQALLHTTSVDMEKCHQVHAANMDQDSLIAYLCLFKIFQCFPWPSPHPISSVGVIVPSTFFFFQLFVISPVGRYRPLWGWVSPQRIHFGTQHSFNHIFSHLQQPLPLNPFT